MLAERFLRPEVLAWAESIPTSSAGRSSEQHAPGHVEGEHAPGHVEDEHAPGHVRSRSRVKPLSSQSFGIQFTLSRDGHEKLRYAQELLGHQIPSGDMCDDMPNASLEERVRVALSYFRVRGTRVIGAREGFAA
jgi:hypothetical protein